MLDRVNSSNYLKLPDNQDLRLAIGLFHRMKRTSLKRYVRNVMNCQCLTTYLFSYSLQSSRRLIPGWAHKAQNMAIHLGF